MAHKTDVAIPMASQFTFAVIICEDSIYAIMLQKYFSHIAGVKSYL